MPATLAGDYSKYPDSIRAVFPHLAGEACELRQSWEVYSHLFMEKQELTDAMGERLGGVLGSFQSMLQDEMFLSITRLTDRDSRGQENLSLWRLLEAIPQQSKTNFGQNVTKTLDEIWAAAAGIRKHRNKRIAHFDLSVSLRSATLPFVTFKEIHALLDKIESLLNLFHWEFEETTMLSNTLPAWDITGAAEITTYKARAYDLLEAEGKIPKSEWRRRTGK